MTVNSFKDDRGKQAFVIDRCREKASQLLAKLGVGNLCDDLRDLPVERSPYRATRTLGYFTHVAANGLGKVVLYPHAFNSEEKLELTVMHEFAHAIVHWQTEGRGEEFSHGTTWQWFMVALGQEPRDYICGRTDRAPETVYAKKNLTPKKRRGRV